MTARDLGLVFRTVRHLRLGQIYYQIYYKLTKPLLRRLQTKPRDIRLEIAPLRFSSFIPAPKSFSNGSFTFLNRAKEFKKQIDWSFREYGLLWTYNLNYFDFLGQEDVEPSVAVELIKTWCDQEATNQVGNDPYPISVRGINWIKFFSVHRINDQVFNASLFASYRKLASRPEYHLRGNHLLENAYSLLFAAYYFRNERFYELASQLLREELSEQVLSDGGHFELSPMYHRILLHRLLDCVNLVINNNWKGHELKDLLRQHATRMLSWLEATTFRSGENPLVNDSASGIAASPADLTGYASSLDLTADDTTLSDSGYRMIRIERAEMFIDVGKIGPDYIPGHAHSDTFNFLLHLDGQEVITEVGTSTYETNARRQVERSTVSHNTVIVNGVDQSEVWASFRVGDRARVTKLEESQNSIRATHDGYRNRGILHTRTWLWSAGELQIVDELSGMRPGDSAVSSLHFLPGIQIKPMHGYLEAGPIRVFPGVSWAIEDYERADGFNRLQPAKVLRVTFTSELSVVIKW